MPVDRAGAWDAVVGCTYRKPCRSRYVPSFLTLLTR